MLQKPIFFVPFPQTTSQMFSCPLRCSVYVYYHVDYQNHLSENCIYRSEGKLGAVFWIFISMYFNIDLKSVGLSKLIWTIKVKMRQSDFTVTRYLIIQSKASSSLQVYFTYELNVYSRL